MQKVYSLLRKNVKWRAVSLIFMAVQSNAFAAAQDSSNVSLNFTNQPIENVFIALEKQTGYTVFFSGSTLDGNTPITVKVSQVTLSNALAAVLRGKNITWTIKHKGIVLSKKPVTAEAPAEPANAALDTVPMINVSGVVVDAKGNPIPAATVSLKGYPRGQGTDNMGRFSFTRVPGNGTLVFSSLGYDPKQVRIAGRGEIRVALDSAIREISAVEVVSTGYQYIPKERATGSFVQIGNETLNRSVSTNVMDRLTNVTSSLKIEREGGSEISIRGLSTINANMKPLIVIDGFPYEEAAGADTRSIFLNNLNPNDIESVTILRDAAAASIWGARSGNGVIVITTKRGAYNKKISVQLSSSVNIFQKPRINDLPIISSRDAIEYERKAFQAGRYNSYDDLFPQLKRFPVISPAMEIMLAQRRNAITPDEAQRQLDQLANHDVRDDINKYLIRDAINQQYNLNISGGSERANYYASIGYDKNLESTKGNEYNRITLRFENTYKPIKIIELNAYITYTQNKNKTNGIEFNQFIADGGATAAPYTFLADKNGNALHVPFSNGYRQPYLDTASSPGLLDWHYKPLDELKYNDRTSNSNAVRFGGGVKVQILPELNAEFRGQYENTTGEFRRHSTIESYFVRNLINQFMYVDAAGNLVYPVPMGSILNLDNSVQKTWNVRGQLNYAKNWDLHSLVGIVGIESRESKYDRTQNTLFGLNPITGTYATNMDFNTNFTKRPMGRGKIGSGGNQLFSTINRFVSYYGNLSYYLFNKYNITASARLDASNIFGVSANMRQVPLWSLGTSWDISKENFYNFNAIPHLKLRVTYGINGNVDNTATALPTFLYQSNPNTYISEPYATMATPPNPGLTWEKIKILNAGLDYNTRNERVSGSIDFYTKKGLDLIGIIESEATTGVSSYKGNYASIKARGLDIMLNAILIKRKINISTSLLFSYNMNEVTDYDLSTAITASNYLNGSLPIKGKPLHTVYSYKWAGLDPKTGDPRGYVADTIAPFTEVLTGTNTQPEDLLYNGNATPPYFGSWINTISYKDLSLTFNITYRFGAHFRRPSINYNNLLTSWGGHSDYALRWKSPGDELKTIIPSEPATFFDDRYSFYSQSEVLVEKSDIVRFKDIRISYNFSDLLSRSKTSAQIYFYVNNVGVIWRANKYNLDPEGQSFISAPRSYAVGLNLNL